MYFFGIFLFCILLNCRPVKVYAVCKVSCYILSVNNMHSKINSQILCINCDLDYIF